MYGKSSGTQLLNKCTPFPSSLVKDDSKPTLKVCGTETKMIIYLRNRCESYHSYQMDIGVCDTSAPSSSCVEKSPKTDRWLMTAQSFKIVQC